LGEVLYKKLDYNDSESLKFYLQKNKLFGIKEGVQQCLIKDVKEFNYNRIISLMKSEYSNSDIYTVPLALSFLIANDMSNKNLNGISKSHNINIDSIFDVFLENQIEYNTTYINKSIIYLREVQNHNLVSLLYKKLIEKIKPDSLPSINLILDSIEYIPKDLRVYTLNSILTDKLIHGDSLDYCKLYFKLAGKLKIISEFEKSIQYYEKTLTILLAKYENEEHLLEEIYNDIALTYNEIGNLDKAIYFIKESLSLSIKIHGINHLMVAICQNNLGLIYKGMGKYDCTLELYHKSFDTFLKVKGKYHTDIAVILLNLSSLFVSKGNYDKAEEYVNDSLSVRLNIYGENHIEIAYAYNLLADIYFKKMLKC
jgi:tetratricopeptide (TPR) repeat protein